MFSEFGLWYSYFINIMVRMGILCRICTKAATNINVVYVCNILYIVEHAIIVLLYIIQYWNCVANLLRWTLDYSELIEYLLESRKAEFPVYCETYIFLNIIAKDLHFKLNIYIMRQIRWRNVNIKIDYRHRVIGTLPRDIINTIKDVKKWKCQ